jgi:hypothetical protein
MFDCQTLTRCVSQMAESIQFNYFTLHSLINEVEFDPIKHIVIPFQGAGSSLPYI